VHSPFDEVTMVFPFTVATLLDTAPPPEWTVTPLPPVVDPVTPPWPAVTLLVMVPEGVSPGLRSTVLQFLLSGPVDELVVPPGDEEDDELELLVWA